MAVTLKLKLDTKDLTKITDDFIRAENGNVDADDDAAAAAAAENGGGVN